MRSYRDFICSICGKPSKRKLYTNLTGWDTAIRNTKTECVSCARTAWTKTEEGRASISKRFTEAYADGTKQPPAFTGQHKDLEYQGHKVSGVYEFFYLKWLIENKIEFICHPRPGLSVIVEGQSKTYFPDFYLVKTNEYVDVKHSHYLEDKRYTNMRKIEVLRTMGYKITITTNADSWFNREEYRAFRRSLR